MAVVAFDNSDRANTRIVKYYTGTTLVAVNATQGSCDVLDIRAIKFLSVKPPALVDTLTFYGSETSTGTFVLINDLGTAGVVNVTASVWNIIDYTKLSPHRFIQMKSHGANGNAVCVGCT